MHSVALQSFPIAWIDNVNKIDSLVGNFDNEVPGDEQLEFAKDLTVSSCSQYLPIIFLAFQY